MYRAGIRSGIWNEVLKLKGIEPTLPESSITELLTAQQEVAGLTFHNFPDMS